MSQNASLRSEPRAYDCGVVVCVSEFPSGLRVAMSRRPLVLLAIALSSLVLSACSDITAPRKETADDATASCRSGTWTGSGRCGG